MKLRIAQSAVSAQIFKLEDFLGEKLMERGPRGFKLTEAGQVTLAQAEEIFRQGNDLVQYFRSGKMKTTFRVGGLGSLSKNLQIKILKPVLESEGIELTLAARELYVHHEFKAIKQSYFVAYRQKGKRHPMLTKLLKR